METFSSRNNQYNKAENVSPSAHAFGTGHIADFSLIRSCLTCFPQQLVDTVVFYWPKSKGCRIWGRELSGLIKHVLSPIATPRLTIVIFLCGLVAKPGNFLCNRVSVVCLCQFYFFGGWSALPHDLLGHSPSMIYHISGIIHRNNNQWGLGVLEILCAIWIIFLGLFRPFF